MFLSWVWKMYYDQSMNRDDLIFHNWQYFIEKDLIVVKSRRTIICSISSGC